MCYIPRPTEAVTQGEASKAYNPGSIQPREESFMRYQAGSTVLMALGKSLKFQGPPFPQSSNVADKNLLPALVYRNTAVEHTLCPVKHSTDARYCRDKKASMVSKALSECATQAPEMPLWSCDQGFLECIKEFLTLKNNIQCILHCWYFLISSMETVSRNNILPEHCPH